jgi:hypothetical protein
MQDPLKKIINLDYRPSQRKAEVRDENPGALINMCPESSCAFSVL